MAITERGSACDDDLELADEGVELASEFFQYAEFINAFRYCNDQDVFFIGQPSSSSSWRFSCSFLALS
jgi:hypothetical protein